MKSAPIRVVAGEGPLLWEFPPSAFAELPGILDSQPESPLKDSAARFGATSIPPNSDLTGRDPLATLCLRLANALLLDTPPAARLLSGIILGTTHGCLHTDLEFDASRREADGRFASPAAFRATLPSSIPAEISVRFDIQGPLLAFFTQSMVLTCAMDRAHSWMRHIRLPLCVAGYFDAPPNAPPRAWLMLLKSVAPRTPAPPDANYNSEQKQPQ